MSVRQSLRNKTIFGIAAIEAVLLLILVVTTLNFINRTASEDLVKRAQTAATLFATTTKDAVLSYDLASLQTFVVELMKNPDMEYVRVIGANGEVFASAGSADRQNSPFVADQNMGTVTDGVFDTLAPITVAQQDFGRVELGIRVSSIQGSILKFQQWVATIAVTEMCLVALFSYILGSYLTRQLRSLRTGAKQISEQIEQGRFDQVRVKVKGQDELAEVAIAFNTLVKTLETAFAERDHSQAQLQEMNRTLEVKVAARTKLLMDKNTKLLKANKELKMAEQQLLQAEKMASVGQLAAGVAHEINNPVGFVGSNIVTLKDYVDVYQEIVTRLQTFLASEDVFERKALAQSLSQYLTEQDLAFIDEDVQSLLQESAEGMNRVKDIVAGLKLFSRADSDQMQPFDLNDCVKTTLAMVNNELKYHCDIKLDLQPLPKSEMNIGKINQVVTNLLINAGQAIEQKGVISIRSWLDGEQIKLSVTDSGSGIDPDNIKRLFDPFFTTKPQGQGTGLGLAISYGIMQEHGGEILVQSSPGTGTRFTLVLPVMPHSNHAEQAHVA